MAAQNKNKPNRYLIFRIEADAGVGSKPLFLTGKSTWTSRRAMAKKGKLTTMKSLIAKLKEAYPDLILEQCRD